MTIYQLYIIQSIILKFLFVTPLAVMIAILRSDTGHQLLFTLLSKLGAREYALLSDTEGLPRTSQHVSLYKLARLL